jgi:ParB-like chromosome segregation protein Spo0J
MTDSARLSMAMLCSTALVPIVPLHGLKGGHCTCPNKNCKQPGDHPRTPNGIDDATTDPGKLREYWTKSPKAKIGIVLGAPDLIAVVVPEESEAKWQEMVARTGEKFNTVEFFSQSSHFFLLRAPPNDIPDGEITLIEGKVLGRGSYVVMPGSLNTSGEKDSFVAGHVIGGIDIESAPDQLLKWLRPPETGIELPVTSTTGSDFTIRRLNAEWIEVPDDPPRNPNQVKLFAEGMRITGVRHPLTVRPIKLYQARRGPRMHRFALLSDPHEFEAIKSLGFTGVDCIVMDINERDARLCQIADILHRPDLSVIDWAELVMEWVLLVREKGGHSARPRGGEQPHDRGFSEAERVLGISRRDLQRAEQICSICDQAKKEIRKINLNVRKAVLQVAREPAENQVAKVHELADAPTARGKQKPKTEPATGPDTAAKDTAGEPAENGPKHTETAPEPEQPKNADDGVGASGQVTQSNPVRRPSELELPDIPRSLDRRATWVEGTPESAALRELKLAWPPSEHNKLFVRLSDPEQANFITRALGWNVAGKVGKPTAEG